MPRKIERLKHEALESCKFRGHQMERFFRPYEKIDPKIVYSNFWRSYCKVCSKYVNVKEKPLPNEIEICGDAVALNCYEVYK
jgi:hypothetical protein